MGGQAIRPCWHMARWVNALVDGHLSGFALWYTNLHLAGCPKCRAALESLRALHRRLQRLNGTWAERPVTLSADRHVALQTALDAIDREASG
ncbi:MAG TPA: hypothetical protein VKU00_13895 [Chthonomonadaceae bacterium]|nr:hypothetical protein [Chthonomonadaceae bacterium]